MDGLLLQLDTAGGGATGGRDQQQLQQGLPFPTLKKADVGRQPTPAIQGKTVMAGGGEGIFGMHAAIGSIFIQGEYSSARIP